MYSSNHAVRRCLRQAQLTVEQFQLHDILAEFDPPSFIRNQLESGLSAQADREVSRAERPCWHRSHSHRISVSVRGCAWLWLCVHVCLCAQGGPEDEEEEAFLGGEDDPYSLVAPAAPMSMQLHVDSTGGQLEEGATSSYAEGGSADLQVKFMPIHQRCVSAVFSVYASCWVQLLPTTQRLLSRCTVTLALCPNSALRDAQLAKNESRQRLYADIYAELGAADATAGLASEAEEVSSHCCLWPLLPYAAQTYL